jgi:hypothetical protein
MSRTQQAERSRFGAPSALLAVIQAARRIGDRELERSARLELAEQHGIELTFRRPRKPEVRDASR